MGTDAWSTGNACGYGTNPIFSRAQHAQVRDEQVVTRSTVITQASFADHAYTTRMLYSISQPRHLTQWVEARSFLRPPPARMPTEDIEYLRSRGALQLPNLALQKALLQAFVESIHPQLPFVNLHTLLSIVHNRRGQNGKISLLLYQAIMFSGSTVVNIEHLRDGGYETRLAAQTALFQRTRLLYDLDYELDAIVIIQSLLLMTLRSGNQGEEKDAWHWVGLAVSLAYAIGLNKIPPAAGRMSPELSLKKRLWWCCLVREQLVALETNRPTRIRTTDWRTTTLTIDDFEFRHLPSKVNDFYSDCGIMKSPNLQHELATIFTAEAGLCTITNRLTQVSSVFKHASKPDITDLGILPNINELLDSVDEELLDWAQSLPSCCYIRDVTPTGVRDDKLVIATRRSILHMLYYATSCIVHRMRYMSSIASVDLKSSVRAPTTSQLRVRESVLHITRIIDDLDRHGLISSLPATERTIICSAISMSMQVMD